MREEGLTLRLASGGRHCDVDSSPTGVSILPPEGSSVTEGVGVGPCRRGNLQSRLRTSTHPTGVPHTVRPLGSFGGWRPWVYRCPSGEIRSSQGVLNLGYSQDVEGAPISDEEQNIWTPFGNKNGQDLDVRRAPPGSRSSKERRKYLTCVRPPSFRFGFSL